MDTFRKGIRGASLILAAVSLLVILLSLPAAIVRSAAAGNGRIYFASNRTGNWEIFAMNPDGSDQVNLTNSPTLDERPGASPDGSKIAFARTSGGNTDIYVMNANGTGLARLTTAAAADHGPQWSPDGERIAFRSDRDGNAEIYVMNADGANQVRLTQNPATDHGPDWSPDGERIVFSSDRSGNDNVYVMNADGSGVTPLTTNSADDFGASWSPDGERIAFRSDRNGEPEVYIMNADGSGQTNLSQNPAADRGPAWSPDGSRIVFYSNRDGNYEIYTMDPDGANKTRVTESPGSDFQPDWASDGNVVEPTCYKLTRAHTGQGANPVASPANSAGCAADHYIADQLITMAATPAAGWHVGGWSGTNNDGSTSTTNTATMPAADHAVSVAYADTPPACNSLSRDHSGSGGDPTANSTNSPGCAAGHYTAGQLIILTATPAAGWTVKHWSGTNNDASTSTINTVTMPASDHAVSVIYEASAASNYRLFAPAVFRGSGQPSNAAPSMPYTLRATFSP